MKVKGLPDWIDTEIEFPVTTTQVVAKAGNREIEAPDRTDSETLATVLERGGETTYQSPAELLDAIHSNLTDKYIGRKYYDDRGMNPGDQERDPSMDTADESF